MFSFNRFGIKDGFRKIEYDYVVNSAQMAKKNGVRQFHLVSSGGADQNSFIWNLKIKGQSEAMVNSLGFEKSVVYRPRFVLDKNNWYYMIFKKKTKIYY